MNERKEPRETDAGGWKWIAGDKPTHAELVPADEDGQGRDSILYHGANWPMREADKQLIAAAPVTRQERDALARALAAILDAGTFDDEGDFVVTHEAGATPEADYTCPPIDNARALLARIGGKA